MRCVSAVVAVLVVATVAGAGPGGVRVVEDAGTWESGYGVEFYNVVGTLEVTGGEARRFVKLRIEALDEAGDVVATEYAYNETAEALSAPDADAAALVAAGKVTPLARGTRQRFRASFLKDEHPTIVKHRVTVADAPDAE